MNGYIDFRLELKNMIACHPTSNLYFLLDCSGLRGLHQELLKSSAEWVSLFNDTQEVNALDVAPIIILAASKGRHCITRSLLNWIGKRGTYSSTVTLLRSPLKIDEIKLRLSERLDSRLSGCMEVMLRFFDPRVLESLKNTLSIKQAEEFFSLSEEWKYLDRAGKMRGFKASFSPEENFSAPLVFSQEQESALLEASEVDQVLDLLRSSFPTALAKLPISEQYEFVKRHADRAKEQGVEVVWKYAFYVYFILSKEDVLINDDVIEGVLEKLKNDQYDNLETT